MIWQMKQPKGWQERRGEKGKGKSCMRPAPPERNPAPPFLPQSPERCQAALSNVTPQVVARGGPGSGLWRRRALPGQRGMAASASASAAGGR